MKSKKTVALIGASGLLGAEVISLLNEQKEITAEWRFFTSSESAGELYSFRGEEIEFEQLTEESLQEVDLAVILTKRDEVYKLLSSPKYGGLSILRVGTLEDGEGVFTPFCVSKGSLSEGLSHSTHSRVRWILPAAPSVVIASVVATLSDIAPVTRGVVSTYHSVSSAGKGALDELFSQSIAVFNQQTVEQEYFAHQIAFNCIPLVDTVEKEGMTREENRIISETKAMLTTKGISLLVTAVRIPVFHGIGLSACFDFASPVTSSQIIYTLSKNNFFVVNEELEECPMLLDVVSQDEIHIARVRVEGNACMLWCSTDNVRLEALTTVEAIKQLVTFH